MTELYRDVFRPREGAVLDLGSLQTLARSQGEALAGVLATLAPGRASLVLHGLDVEGEVAPQGPPGTVRPDGLAGGAVVTPGKALLTARDGQVHLIEVPAPIHVPWPEASGSRVRGSLVLYAAHLETAGEGGVAVARERLQVRVGFVKPEQDDQPHLLPIARAVGNGQDWATDLARVLQPEHAAVQHLVKRVERLGHSVWKAEPEGAVWDRQVLGRSWVRYQTVASAALESAALQLQTRAMTTRERVRMLAALRDRLDKSVERVATELLQIVGPADGAGPYKAVLGSEG